MKPLLAAAAFAFVAVQAHATLSRAITFDEKVNNAAAIILGKCLSTDSRWDDSRKWILTYSTFQIEKSFKGQPVQQITIVTPGGSVEGIHQNAIGIPRFAAGDEHVLFVRHSQVGPTVLYFDQGAYDVIPVRGERLVQPMVSSAVLIDTQRGMAVNPEAPRSLREFESSVRESMRREAVKMEMIERQKKEEASISNVIRRNKTLVILALIGAVLATWQLVKRW